jgi:GNAT superfamily N-acetyltransferase
LPGEVTQDDVARQVDAGEWHVLPGGDGVLGALRLLWSDEPIWREEDRFAAYVHGLMVDRAHAGTGLGQAMLGWVEAQARVRGAALFRLDCCESNTALRAYYGAQGFREVGRRDFDGAWFSATLFEKSLASPTGADDRAVRASSSPGRPRT